MIKYSDLVDYTKKHHVNWNQDLFDVLRGFFLDYLQPLPPPPSSLPVQQEPVFTPKEFKESADGEYTIEDVMNLFSQ